MPVKIYFFGATQTVTGSKFVVESDGCRVLVDCGLFQGLKRLRLRNWDEPPFEVDSIDAVLLTHAHLDHAGFLPRLVREGFKGDVYATPATSEVARVLLLDAARLQEEDARYANKKGFSKHRPALPLFSTRHAKRALKLIRPTLYDSQVRLSPTLAFQFRPAGHILGSAFVQMELSINGATSRVLFSGDLGRYDIPILPDPASIERADYLVLESTYGNRLHSDEDPKTKLAELIQRVVRERASLLIPAFTIGRTQELIYVLTELFREKAIPDVPVFLDSPMAIDVTEIYCRHPEDHDLDMKKLVDVGSNPLKNEHVTFVQSTRESKKLNEVDPPLVIIAGSGMATGGRILHHLKRCLPDKKNVVLFIGFQAAGTRGRMMIEGADKVKIHGRHVPIGAQIEVINSFSAHADYEEILRWLGKFKELPKRIFLVHGEAKACAALKEKIESRFNIPCTIPSYEDSVELT